MARAVELSRQGFPAPNPHVGCVVVLGGDLVGEGYHDHAGGPHAEVVALERAGAKAKGADVYVTLEPCNHAGRTGPCSEALIRAGVKSVTFAVEDPNPRAGGGGQRLREKGIKTISGVLASEAEAENRPFLTAMRRAQPFVALKAATTLDGFIALPDGESKWITGPEARAASHWLRAQMGAVLVGANTIRKDDPQLTARIEGVVNQPVRIVLDPNGSVSPSARVFTEQGEALHFVSKSTFPGQIELPTSGGVFDLERVLDELWKRNVTSVLVEGGGITLGRFLQAGLFDRLDLFVAPKLFGAGVPFTGDYKARGIAQALQLALVREKKVGEDLWLTLCPDPRRPEERYS